MIYLEIDCIIFELKENVWWFCISEEENWRSKIQFGTSDASLWYLTSKKGTWMILMLRSLTQTVGNQ